MPAPTDRRVLELARDIFEGLGAVAASLQIYGRAHRRFAEAKEALVPLVRGYFESQPSAKNLSYRTLGDAVEFQGVPLACLNAHGERLAGLLKGAGAGILRVGSGIAAGDIEALVDALNARALRGDAIQGSFASESPGAFELLSAEEARKVVYAPEDRPKEETADRDIALPELRVTERALEALLAAYQAALGNLERGISFEYAALRDATGEIARIFQKRRNAFWLSLARGYFDDFTFHHSVNVALMAAKVASVVTSDEGLLGRIATAALLHDIGKTRIPRDILYKPGKLTPGEFEVMRAHPALGAEILLGADGVDPLAVAAAFRHHTRPGAGSYPETLLAYEADWATELISVVDVYEAVTAARPYKKPIPAEKAFAILAAMPGYETRLELVKLLYDVFGPYPVGAVVQLNTGERAVVLEENRADLYRPKIRILVDRNRIAYPVPRDVDLLLVPGRGEEGGLWVERTVIPERPGENPLEKDLAPDTGGFLRGGVLEDDWFGQREG
ncbi:MAG: HD-GYP domain-containing protein [Planctomycetota bacterium]